MPGHRLGEPVGLGGRFSRNGLYANNRDTTIYFRLQKNHVRPGGMQPLEGSLIHASFHASLAATVLLDIIRRPDGV